MNLKEQLKAKKAALLALKAKIEAGDDEAIKAGNTLADEIEALEAKIKSAEKAAAALSRIGTSADDDSDGNPAGEKASASLGDHFVKHMGARPARGSQFTISAPEYKAATDVQTVPAAIQDALNTIDRNIVSAVRVPLTVRQMFGAETISGNALIYYVEGAREGNFAVTAEGTAKPQIHFADPAKKTVTLDKIAGFLKESDEYIDDAAFLASTINGRLLYELGLFEQNYLVSALVGTNGIQTDATNWTAALETAGLDGLADLILKAAMDIQSATGFNADGILMNPADWYKMRVAKNGDRSYYGGGFFGAQDGANLWGIPVNVTSAVTAGQIMVGAFKACGSVVSKGGVAVSATNTDQDDFVKNLMTIRAEERLALAVRRPAGFKLLTKVQ